MSLTAYLIEKHVAVVHTESLRMVVADFEFLIYRIYFWAGSPRDALEVGSDSNFDSLSEEGRIIMMCLYAQMVWHILALKGSVAPMVKSVSELR